MVRLAVCGANHQAKETDKVHTAGKLNKMRTEAKRNQRKPFINALCKPCGGRHCNRNFKTVLIFFSAVSSGAVHRQSRGWPGSGTRPPWGAAT